MTRPLSPLDCYQQSGIDNADRVMSSPADSEFTTNWRRLCNVFMHEVAARQVPEPAANHPPIRQWDAPKAFRQLSPKVNYDRSTDTD